MSCLTGQLLLSDNSTMEGGPEIFGGWLVFSSTVTIQLDYSMLQPDIWSRPENAP